MHSSMYSGAHDERIDAVHNICIHDGTFDRIEML